MTNEIELKQAQTLITKLRSTPLIQSFRQGERGRKLEQASNVLVTFKEQRVSYFDIFRKAGFKPDENMFSNAVAALLDPREGHQLGIYPLQKLLEDIEVKASTPVIRNIIDGLEQNRPYIKVFRERREDKTIPDLEIVGRDFLIFIENKIRGGQETFRYGQWQTERQWAVLQSKSIIHGVSVLAIFLTPEGKPARNSNFVSLSVTEMAASLRKTVITAPDCPYTHSIEAFLDFYIWE